MEEKEIQDVVFRIAFVILTREANVCVCVCVFKKDLYIHKFWDLFLSEKLHTKPYSVSRTKMRNRSMATGFSGNADKTAP